MRAVVLGTLRHHARRYVAAVVAVALAVGFVVATHALTSAARAGLLADLAASYRGADVVVTQMTSPRDLRRVLAATDAHGLRSAVTGYTMTPVSAGGVTLGEATSVGTVSDEPALRWQRLTSGAFPAGPGETVVDQGFARTFGIGVGDTVRLGAGADRMTGHVTGLVGSTTGSHQDSAYVSLDDLRRLSDSVVASEVLVATADPDRTVRVLREDLGDRLQVVGLDEHLVAHLAGETRGVDVVGAVMLGFAAIALFVAVLVIANTFSMLLAHRQQELALLRCVGATRRQVLRAVRREALAVGAGAATLGLLVGVGLGHALTGLSGRFFPDLPMAGVPLSPLWLAGGWLAGVAVTVGASALPARRGTAVSPVAALRPTGPVAVTSGAGRVRLLLAVAALWGGSALLVLSMREHQLPVMLAGGFATFVGVLLLGPLVVPAVIRVVGRLLGVLGGTTTRLATANAVRNPRRTAATAGSLLVGVTLVSGMVVGMATVRATAAREMNTAKPLDASLTAAGGPLDAGLAARVRAVDGVATVRVLEGTTGRLQAGRTDLGAVTVLGAGPAAAGAVHGRADFVDPAPGTLVVPWDLLMAAGVAPDARLALVVGDTRRVFDVQPANGIGQAVLVAPGDLAALTDRPRPSAVWARTAPGVDAAAATGELTALARAAGAGFAGGLTARAFVDTQLDVMLGAVVAMLTVGVLIALVGVGATLGLSVLERTREHALLRALGLTRTRLRAVLAVEAMLLAGVAGLLGAALGTGYAWVAVEAVVGQAVGATALVVPWGSLAGLVALAAVAGLAAGVLPSRRAARVAPAAGLSA